MSPCIMSFQWNHGTKKKSDKITGIVKKRQSMCDRAPISNKINKLDTHTNKLLFKGTWKMEHCT